MNRTAPGTSTDRIVAASVAVGGALAWSQPWSVGSDLWWHLAAGREIWSRFAVPATDSFSFTFAGREWLNHEWLWDVLYWGLYDLHPDVVAWFNLGIVAVVFALVFGVALQESHSAVAAGLALWIVAAAMHWYIDIRPHLFTLLLVGVFLLTRERSWAPWLWPPLVILWVNLHGGFVFGVGMIGLFVLVRAIETAIRKDRPVIDRNAWISVALCLLAMLANPWGYRILAYPLAYLEADSPFRAIIEWRPPHFSLDLAGFNGRFTLITVLAVLGAPLAARRSRYLLALVVVTFAMAFTSRRFIPLFAVTAAPLGALFVARVVERLAARLPAIRRRAAALSVVALAAIVAVVLWQDVRLRPRLLDRWTVSSKFPEAAVTYLKALDRPLRVLNEYSWGGYLLLHAPQLEVFIDGRANTLYDDELYEDYLRIQNGDAQTRRLAERYGADVALTPVRSAMATTLLTGPGGWTPLYEDTVARILVPPRSPLLESTLPRPAALLSGHVEMFLVQSAIASRAADFPDAADASRRALELDPLILRGYGQLVWIAVQTGDRVALEQIIEQGIRANPRAEPFFRRLQGIAYEDLGDLGRAAVAYRAAVPRGPFIEPDEMRAAVQRVEERLANRESPKP